jgi:O-antigen/teichoic acid export membrane protein
VSSPDQPALPDQPVADIGTEAPAVTSRHVAKGVGTTLLSRLGAVIEIVAQPLYVWLFGLASFGLYAVLWAAINLIENIFDLGMTSAMQRTVPQSTNDREAADALRAAVLLGVGPCILAAVLITLAAEPLASWINVAASDRDLVIPAIKLFVWALPLWAFVEIATSALRARHLFGPEIRLRLVWEMLIRLVLAVAFYFAGLGLNGLFIAHLMSLTITAALCLRLVAQHYRLSLLFSGPLVTPMFVETVKAGLSILPSNMVARLFGDAPAVVLNIAIPGAAGAQAGALFTIARKVSSVVQLVRIAFVYVLAPLASSAERADRAQVHDIYSYAVRLILVIALPLAVVLSAGSAPLLRLFGPDAMVAQGAMIILLLARAMEAVVGISLPVLQVVAGFRHQLTASIVGVIVAALVGWPLMQVMNPLTGLTLAVSIGFVVAAAIPMIQLQVHEALNPLGPDLGRAAVRTIGISAVALLLALGAAMLPDAAALPLVLVIGLGAIWCSARLALPLADRESLGKTGRKLRLV